MAKDLLNRDIPLNEFKQIVIQINKKLTMDIGENHVLLKEDALESALGQLYQSWLKLIKVLERFIAHSSLITVLKMEINGPRLLLNYF